MNGNDFFGGQEGLTTPEPTFQSSTPSVFGDFLGAAQTKFSEITEKFRTAPTSPESSVGGSIFNALYAFGAGKVDLARERAAQALLQSRTGQRFVGEVERQRIQQWMPLIIGGVIVLLVAGFAVGRR